MGKDIVENPNQRKAGVKTQRQGGTRGGKDMIKQRYIYSTKRKNPQGSYDRVVLSMMNLRVSIVVHKSFQQYKEKKREMLLQQALLTPYNFSMN